MGDERPEAGCADRSLGVGGFSPSNHVFISETKLQFDPPQLLSEPLNTTNSYKTSYFREGTCPMCHTILPSIMSIQPAAMQPMRRVEI